MVMAPWRILRGTMRMGLLVIGVVRGGMRGVVVRMGFDCWEVWVCGWVGLERGLNGCFYLFFVDGMG